MLVDFRKTKPLSQVKAMPLPPGPSSCPALIEKSTAVKPHPLSLPSQSPRDYTGNYTVVTVIQVLKQAT